MHMCSMSLQATPCPRQQSYVTLAGMHVHTSRSVCQRQQLTPPAADMPQLLPMQAVGWQPTRPMGIMHACSSMLHTTTIWICCMVAHSAHTCSGQLAATSTKLSPIASPVRAAHWAPFLLPAGVPASVAAAASLAALPRRTADARQRAWRGQGCGRVGPSRAVNAFWHHIHPTIPPPSRP
jgi:hypothetical protein